MTDTIYEIVEKFDPTKDYGIRVRKAIAKCLGTLEKGKRLVPGEFAKQNMNRFSKATKISNKVLVYNAFKVGVL